MNGNTFIILLIIQSLAILLSVGSTLFTVMTMRLSRGSAVNIDTFNTSDFDHHLRLPTNTKNTSE